MKEFKGTNGPWKMAGLSESGNSHFKVIGTKLGGRYKIARIPFLKIINPEPYDGYNEKEMAEAKANAVLISAAFELLEALQGLLPIAENWINENHYWHIKATAAIQKALSID